MLEHLISWANSGMFKRNSILILHLSISNKTKFLLLAQNNSDQSKYIYKFHHLLLSEIEAISCYLWDFIIPIIMSNSIVYISLVHILFHHDIRPVKSNLPTIPIFKCVKCSFYGWNSFCENFNTSMCKIRLILFLNLCSNIYLISLFNFIDWNSCVTNLKLFLVNFFNIKWIKTHVQFFFRFPIGVIKYIFIHS